MANVKIIQNVDGTQKIRNFKNGDNSQKILDAIKEKLYIDYKKSGYQITSYEDKTCGSETEIRMTLVKIGEKISQIIEFKNLDGEITQTICEKESFAAGYYLKKSGATVVEELTEADMDAIMAGLNAKIDAVAKK